MAMTAWAAGTLTGEPAVGRAWADFGPPSLRCSPGSAPGFAHVGVATSLPGMVVTRPGSVMDGSRVGMVASEVPFEGWGVPI
ncbi:MAG TPA: hypothetical protein VFP72_12825 [Kineosporiaceae bacterium]|nr:hypothetical protein [Kineosporiaceae bacterium]